MQVKAFLYIFLVKLDFHGEKHQFGSFFIIAPIVTRISSVFHHVCSYSVAFARSLPLVIGGGSIKVAVINIISFFKQYNQ
jgi:hypothetical protein